MTHGRNGTWRTENSATHSFSFRINCWSVPLREEASSLKSTFSFKPLSVPWHGPYYLLPLFMITSEARPSSLWGPSGEQKKKRWTHSPSLARTYTLTRAHPPSLPRTHALTHCPTLVHTHVHTYSVSGSHTHTYTYATQPPCVSHTCTHVHTRTGLCEEVRDQTLGQAPTYLSLDDYLNRRSCLRRRRDPPSASGVKESVPVTTKTPTGSLFK